MDISKGALLGNSSLGIFALATEKYAIVPYGVKEELIKGIKVNLEVEVIQNTIANSLLVGTMVVGNSNTLFIPENTSEKEISNLEKIIEGVNVVEIKTKFTALGNLIVMNDKGAIISEMFEKEAQRQIKDVLGQEVISGNLLGSPLIGSMIMVTNRGALLHPLVSEEEMKEVESVLKVRADVCTVNRGIPYPRVGILANSKGAFIGSDCTGPESMRIFEILLAP